MIVNTYRLFIISPTNEIRGRGKLESADGQSGVGLLVQYCVPNSSCSFHIIFIKSHDNKLCEARPKDLRIMPLIRHSYISLFPPTKQR